MPIQWRDQFSVGNDLIDADHQYLIEIINKAEKSLQAHNATELTALINELAHYGKLHFDREERLARAVAYPKAEQLHLSHDALVESLGKFRESVGEVWPPEATEQFTTFLRDWLIQHVIKEDLPMKPWITKFSPRFDPR